MSELDKLLEPIAGSNPCGVDLEYDSRLQALKNMVESGTRESPADWKKVRKQCLELLNDGRSIELLVLLAVSMVAIDGFQGLYEGLNLLTKSIQDYWDNIYPELDPEEPERERYEIRLNAIAQLGENPGKLGDTLCFVEKVLLAPVSIDNLRLSICFWPIWEYEVSDGDEEPSDEAKAAISHIRQMSYEDSKKLSECISKTIKCLNSFNEFLMDKTGTGYNAPFDDVLIPVLNQINSKFKVDGQVDMENEDDETGEEGSPAAGSAPSAVAAPPPGTINTREDVKEALGKIIEYYRDNEPSSPVPYLLMRTQELIDSDFMDVIRNLVKEVEPQFKKVLNLQ